MKKIQRFNCPLFLGVRKKLEALAKERDCGDLQPWIQSIINHLYWSAVSSRDDPKGTILAKWQSITNHICDIHSGHHELFPRCLHKNIERNWLKNGMFTVIVMHIGL